ncbi:hypothetical protein [Bradyrhizobium sp. STM 3561]|uniref:hypothetical protein n=1 Tax=Bradyrhizobium sp. STM 3561 TaxID=578923 RepID=UPI003890CD38
MAIVMVTMTSHVAHASQIVANSRANRRYLIEVFGKSASRDLLEFSLSCPSSTAGSIAGKADLTGLTGGRRECAQEPYITSCIACTPLGGAGQGTHE